MATPPGVFAEIPARKGTLALRATNIEFNIEGASGIDQPSINVQIRIGGTAFIPAMTAGVAQFPYNGASSGITGIDELRLKVVLDYRGTFPSAVTIDVRVDANSESPFLAMDQHNYFFSVNRVPLAGIQLVQIVK